LLNSDTSFVWAGAKCQKESGVIIEYGERMAALTISKHEMTFEIHLPKLVWALHAEADERLVLARLRRVNTTMTSQDRCYCAWSWELVKSLVGKEACDLPGSPSFVQVADTQHSILCGIFCAGWRMDGSFRAVCKG